MSSPQFPISSLVPGTLALPSHVDSPYESLLLFRLLGEEPENGSGPAPFASWKNQAPSQDAPISPYSTISWAASVTLVMLKCPKFVPGPIPYSYASLQLQGHKPSSPLTPQIWFEKVGAEHSNYHAPSIIPFSWLAAVIPYAGRTSFTSLACPS